MTKPPTPRKKMTLLSKIQQLFVSQIFSNRKQLTNKKDPHKKIKKILFKLNTKATHILSGLGSRESYLHTWEIFHYTMFYY